METAMNKCLAATGALAILAAALLVSGRADAGASASAPSKYGHNTNQVATAYPASGKRQPRGPEYGITEYSSSSARAASHRHQDR
jgi:hypothetical protein